MKKRVISLILCLFMLFPLCIRAEEATDPNQILLEQHGFDFIIELADFIAANYKFDVTSEQLKDRAIKYMYETGDTSFDGVMRAMFTLLDAHSAYFTKEEFEAFVSYADGSTVGIGVNIVSTSKGLLVIDVFDGSPAQKAGIIKGDVITTVGDVDIKGMDIEGCTVLIKGEAGTTVKIGLTRQTEAISLNIVRGNVEINPVSVQIIDDKTAYLRLSQFTLNSDYYIKNALSELDKKGITKIALDLRDNPGGYLHAAVSICDSFLPAGPVVYISYKDPKNDEIFYSTNKAPKYKLAVLVNQNTASAAELFAGSAQDTGVAKVFGENTYHKGTVQTTTELVTGAALKITIAKYYTAKKQDVNATGIIPDFKINNDFIYADESKLEQLDFDNYPKIGDSSKAVLAIEQRLSLLGYMIDEPDDNFDDLTAAAIEQFNQTVSGKKSDIVDFNLIFKLNNIEYSKIKLLLDNQLESALTYLKELN